MSTKVLHIVDSMNIGGIETMLMNVYRVVDKREFSFDFFESVSGECFYDDEIYALGGTVYKSTSKSRHPVRYCRDLYRAIRKNNYEIVHIHTSNAMAALPAAVAKICGCRKIIVHSHSSNSNINAGVQRAVRMLLNRLADVKLSCSDLASEWMYGKYASYAVVINNPIDLERFQYNEHIRMETRAQLHLTTEKTFIHVGRFTAEKNHVFLIDVFNELCRLNPDCELLLVGAGPLQEEIRKKAADLALSDKVVFLGIRSDVHKVLQAADAFIFPSLYEGLPLTLVEAQASGLPCFVSDAVTKMVQLTDRTHYLPLGEGAAAWAKTIMQKNEPVDREHFERGRLNQFDVREITDKIQKIYIG